MARLTSQQLAALEVSDASVVLSAGAGCGKTLVLTERFVAALSRQPRVPLDQMAALTFTDKAATELRQRVRKACRAKLDAGEDRTYWSRVLRELEAAPIGTFHNFCGEVTRRFAVRAGVDPGFSVLDESIAATCREEAVDVTLRRALREKNSGLRALAVVLGLNTVRDALVRLLGDRNSDSLEFWASQEPSQLLKKWGEVFETKGRQAIITSLNVSSMPCLTMIQSRGPGFPSKMAASLAILAEEISRIGERADISGILSELREYAKMPPGLRADKWPDPDLYETCREVFKEFREQVDKLIESLKHDALSTALAADLGVKLAQLGARAVRDYAAIKRRRGALDFDDLLHKTRDLLRIDANGVRDELRRQYQLILVDEFQDTDPVQDEIVRRIAGDDLAEGRLFLVGDVKQSIYGFRGARPELLAAFRDEFPVEGQLLLTENFRSRPGILHFVNALFADALDPYEPLNPGRVDGLDDVEPTVVFSWAASGDTQAGKGRSDLDAKRSEEANRLARLVRSWIDQGRIIRDRDTGKRRPMVPGDVAFLFRTLNDVDDYERALVREGFDFYVVGGSAFFAQQEVQDIINVLAVLDDPHDALSLAGALRSPFFALSDEALYWLATLSADIDLFEALARCTESTLPELTPDDGKIARRAFELLTRWRSFKDREPIAALVDRVLDESGFEAALMGEPLGDRKRANARKLVRLARSFDSEGGFALADFVARLRADMKNPPREEQAATTGELGGAIRLLTVHKAKGLDFPVVILPDLDRRANDTRSRVVLDNELGPLLDLKADEESEDDDLEPASSLGWMVHRQIRQAQEADEALRVLYVAATRARELLVLSTSDDPQGKPRSAAMRLLVDRFDPVNGACRKDLPDGWSEPRVQVLFGGPPGDARSRRGKKPIPLRAIARMIDKELAIGLDSIQQEGGTEEPSRATSPVSYIDLNSRSGRLESLVRAILLDPRSVRRGALQAVATELARRQVPAAGAGLVAEAIDRTRHWVEGSLGRAIAAAVEVRRDLAWSTTWPADQAEASVISGCLDLAYRDRNGGWHLVNVADASAPLAPERLRLALSSRLAVDLDCSPVAQAWLLTHGAGGGLRSEPSVDDAAIGELLRSSVLIK